MSDSINAPQAITSGPNAGAVLPPQQQTPGLVQNPAPAVQQTAPQPEQGNSEPNPVLDAITKLTAALADKNGSTAGASAQVPAAAGEDLNSLDPNTIEDPTVRSLAGAFALVGDGLDFNRALGAAISRGDAGLLDEAYLREKAGAKADKLISLGKSIVEAVQQASERAVTSVYSLAGSEDNWKQASAAFNKGAPPELRTVVATMLDSGKQKQIDAAAKLVVEYAKSAGLVPTPGSRVQSTPGASSAEALDKAAFQAEVRKLDPMEDGYNRKYEALVQRRQLGRELGL